MGLLFKAKGSSSFGLLLIRLSIGSIFLFAGAKKAMDVEGFILYVKSLELMPANLAFISGFILPFAEMLFGALFLIGFFTPLTSLALSFMTVGFIGVTALNTPENQLYTIPVYAFYIVILACTLTTLFSGAGIISLDVFLDKKKGREITVTDTPKTENVQVQAPQGIQDAVFEDVKNAPEKIEINETEIRN
jgi:uncharacterized membrane protein YphA (DoxX/SURF4 family)